MKDILLDLYYERMNLSDEDFDKNSKYGVLMREIMDAESLLIKSLINEERDAFMQFASAQRNLNQLTAEQKFVKGFKLGVQLLLACMDEDLSELKIQN